jgi:hypothetical protein
MMHQSSTDAPLIDQPSLGEAVLFKARIHDA